MRLRFVYYAVLLSLLQSCVADCKEEHIKKPVWQTNYEDYWIKQDSVRIIDKTIDTLVAYELITHRLKKEYLENNHDELISVNLTHYISIKNTNNTYSNDFAVRITGKEYNESSSQWIDYDRTTNYVTIKPNESCTFVICHSDRWRNSSMDYAEANVQFHVLQHPQTITYKKQIVNVYNKKCIRRRDKLIYIDTIVNNCECDVDALKSEYKAIKETFERLNKENLIRE